MEAYRDKVVAITGSSGYLSTALRQRLFSVAHRILCVSRNEPEAQPMSGAAPDWLSGSPQDKHLWRDVVRSVDYVFHLAGQTSVYEADQNPPADWSANVEPMQRLLEACREEKRAPMILYAGSATQCGLPESLPVSESIPDRPVTIYDWHKLLSEIYLEHYVRQGWARGATLRLANVYGPGKASGSPDRGVLNQMMRRALRGEDLTLYGDGAPVRDYVYVDDAIEAFVAAGSHAGAVNGKHFVVGTGQGTSLADAFAEVADKAAQMTGRGVSVNRVAPPPALSPIEQRNFVADASAFRAATGWSARISLAEGIVRTLRAFRAQPTESA